MSTVAEHRRPERIAVGIDGSLSAHAAVRWAVDHARPGDTITLTHVWQPSPSNIDDGPEGADEEMAARSFVGHELTRIQARPRDDNVVIEADVMPGDARTRLCLVEVDLLVIGAGGHGLLGGVLLGSVSSYLAGHSPVPLVIVPMPGQRRDERPAPDR